ncbi:MAG: decaprenylphospho-beta-D-erythro-pentofuranosid-2-ulose 2-reductase [Mycobacteriales bacterium]
MIDALGAPQSLLVFGGTSDIAMATARRLAAGGRLRRVVLAGRPGERLDAAAEDLRTAGVDSVETVAFDATETDAHAETVDKAFAEGDLDVVLVAFGVLGDQEQAENDPAHALRIAQVNYAGAVSVGVAVARRLRAQGHGTLVALSSVAGERPRRSNFVYGSSKAGLDAFYTGLGDALHGTGARVLVVRPGFVRSRMTEGLEDAPLSTTPEAVAESIARGLKSGKETIWVPARLRYVMSGLRHVPRGVFRKLPL